ncbi:hypothetical protein QJ850_gp304 [Acanthamoeba polyphaga mimivirus]|uniref:Uncharacterized protein n=1 Tax=Acanthamoeba polyphaga mimivirus Kroon TaxID=3069720 RepID=A0A0G2Y3L7_9VIRU|nr:hypothetical protein QJ850_gp304 [Acanthamoeba polyphaga mimivirus]AKI80395.1 hypothetical protein [Acanthamoeba polyphaga mimivirus Kroon]
MDKTHTEYIDLTREISELSDHQEKFDLESVTDSLDDLDYSDDSNNPENELEILPEDIHTKKIIIDWTRHAESCSNLDSNNVHDTDEYPLRKTGYDNLNNHNKYLSEKPNTSAIIMARKMTSKVKALAMYHPNISYIGCQQAVLLGSYLTKKEYQYDAVFASPTVRSIMTALMICRGLKVTIYVVPYINEHTNLAKSKDNQNTPLNSTLLKKQILYIKDWLENNWINNFDDIYVMNVLGDLRKEMINMVNNPYSEDIIKKIDYIFNCKPNLKKDGGNVNDYGQKCAIFEEINDIIKILDQNFSNVKKSTLIERGVFDEDLESIHDTLKKITDKKFIRGPSVNFTILEMLEKIESEKIPNDDKFFIHQNLRKSCLNKFYTKILPISFNLNFINRNKITIAIMCVSHGGAMKKYFKSKYPSKNIPDHVLNTQIFREAIFINDKAIEAYSIDFNYYVPRKIRATYSNFETLNIDICRLGSLKGILNYPLYSPEWESKIKPKLSFKTLPPVNYATPDSKFYFENRDKYQESITDHEIMGGFNFIHN